MCVCVCVHIGAHENACVNLWVDSYGPTLYKHHSLLVEKINRKRKIFVEALKSLNIWRDVDFAKQSAALRQGKLFLFKNTCLCMSLGWWWWLISLTVKQTCQGCCNIILKPYAVNHLALQSTLDGKGKARALLTTASTRWLVWSKPLCRKKKKEKAKCVCAFFVLQ